jgi:riboflavin synthase
LESVEARLFTGLIEEQGYVASVSDAGSARDLIIRCVEVSSDARIGDSIAINGCCLTVTAITGSDLTFQAGSETLGRTNLGLLSPGDLVNLERSLQVGAKMGGHFVTGHVDGLGVIDQRLDDGQWSEFWFRVPNHLTRQMASKGSIAVDGISLTLVNVESERFSIALIPHTLAVTTLGRRKIGDTVNIETDLLAKYVEQQLLSTVRWQ